MLILGLLGMYFDAVVVFVTNSSLFSDWLWPYCARQVLIVLRIYNFAESADLGLGNLISLELNSIKHEKCIF